MKLLARLDILAEGQKVKAGTELEVSEATGLQLVRLGWAEELPEEVKAPVKAAKKKNTKK